MNEQSYVFNLVGLGKPIAGGKLILEDISLGFLPGAKIGVLGPNGAGKSTLLRIMAGIDQDIVGEAHIGKGLKVGYLPQEPKLDATLDVRANVEAGLSALKALLVEFEQISEQFAEPMEDTAMDALLARQAEVQEAIEAAGAWELERRIEVAGDALRLPPWDSAVDSISGGERRRVALCQLLLAAPDVLLLDEPTNHLDVESVAWLEQFLADFPGTVVAVTHDRYFLDNVAQWILELDRGRGIPFKGNYSAWLEYKEQRLASEAKQQAAQQKSIARELAWVRSNPKGRQTKNKARLRQFEELQSRQYQQRNETNELYIPPGPRLGDQVLEINGVRKAYGSNLLIDDLSLRVPPGAIIGVIGANGAGKTTLFNMLLGKAAPDSGTIQLGETVKLSSVDQFREQLPDQLGVWEFISDGLDEITVGPYRIPSRAYVGRFNFKGQDQQKQIGTLSGGERNRVHLAYLLRSGGNFLLLDEPTNDLDVSTLRALEQALLAFPGSALVISHDRWFLDRIATHILAFEGNSETVWFEGNYADYLQDLKARKGELAGQPQRIKYRRLEI